jgi:hypothetical protein
MDDVAVLMFLANFKRQPWPPAVATFTSFECMSLAASPNRPEDGTSSRSMFAHSLTRVIKQKLFGISPVEVSTERRRFIIDCPQKQKRIEDIGTFFLKGYHVALASSPCEVIHESLANCTPEYRGFAYEGAAMALGLLDYLQPWGACQFGEFLSSANNSYPYLTHVGIGWALARLPWAMHRFCQTHLATPATTAAASSVDSLLGCLALDGYGFHQSYFNWETYVTAMKEPHFLSTDCLPIFRQGVGRSLCFVFGMNSERVADSIARFPSCRHADYWSGVGLAIAYAGGLSAADVGYLLRRASDAQAALAQGVAFAVKARQTAGFVPEHTHLVCEAVWGQPVAKVALLTDTTLADIPLTSKTAAYTLWRQRIQQAFA